MALALGEGGGKTTPVPEEWLASLLAFRGVRWAWPTLRVSLLRINPAPSFIPPRPLPHQGDVNQQVKSRGSVSPVSILIDQANCPDADS